MADTKGHSQKSQRSLTTSIAARAASTSMARRITQPLARGKAHFADPLRAWAPSCRRTPSGPCQGSGVREGFGGRPDNTCIAHGPGQTTTVDPSYYAPVPVRPQLSGAEQVHFDRCLAPVGLPGNVRPHRDAYIAAG